MRKDRNKRKAIPKSVRFEVFKRDSFCCQYCGASAPEVLLQIDHIKPVSKGGTNDITNLLTCCAGCNSGKSDRELDDQSVVSKSRKQMEELQQRREQLEMMMAWREGLRNLKDEAVERVCEYWRGLAASWVVNETGKAKVAKWIRQLSIAEVCQAMDIAAEQYFRFEDDGNVTSESWNAAFEKIPGICRVERASKEDPDVKELYYIRGIVRNRLEGRYFDNAESLDWLKAARSWNVPMDELRAIATRVKSWTQFKNTVSDAIAEQKRHQGSADNETLE